MLLRLGLGLGVTVFTLASTWNNWDHLRQYGMGVAAIVIAAELFKLFCPIALIVHAGSRATFQWIATLTLWAIVVLFSFVNTFGNTLVRHAKVKEETTQIARETTRPEHVIMREMALLKQCPPLRKVRLEPVPPVKGKAQPDKRVPYEEPDLLCEQQRAADQLALTTELTETKRRQSIGREVAISGNTATDGYIMVANMFGVRAQRYEMDVWIVLLWTLLCEVGSAFGGLTIPMERKEKKAP